jgi:hypothetical protein
MEEFFYLLETQETCFFITGLIDTLDVEENVTTKSTHARGAEGGSSANLVQKKNFQPHKFKNRNTFDGEEKFDAKNKTSHYIPTKRRRLI